MRLQSEPTRIIESDAEIAEAVADVTPTPLLAAVAALTGDLSVLRDDLLPDTGSFDPNAGLSEEQIAAARAVAVEALVAFRDAGSVPAPSPGPEALRRILEFVAGGPVTDDYCAVMTEELALDGADLRAPDWQADAVAPGRDFLVAIVGAGMSGIAAAHRLAQAGVDVVILEKNADVGGTWLENRYPGCRVDVPNHFYSYSFFQRRDWPQRFAPQAALLEYFREVADEFDLRQHIRFGVEVTDVVYDEA